MSSINITPANGNKNLSAGVYSGIYTAPSGCISATVNVRLVSHDLTQDVATRLAIAPAGFVDGLTTPPGDNTWIQPVDLLLGPNGVNVGIVEDTAIVLSPGETIVAYANKSLANARVHGLVRTIGV